MEKKCSATLKNSVFVLFLVTAVANGHLQDEYWNSGYWVPNSKMYSSPLLFSHYSVPAWGYDHQLNSRSVEDRSNDFYSNRRSWGSDGDSWLNREGRKYFISNDGAHQQRAFVTSKEIVNSSDNGVFSNLTKTSDDRKSNVPKLSKERSDLGSSEIGHRSEHVMGREKTSEIAHKNEHARTMNNRRVDSQKNVNSMGNKSDVNSNLPKNHKQDFFDKQSGMKNNSRLTEMEPRNGNSRTDKQREDAWVRLFQNKDFEKNRSNNRHNNTQTRVQENKVNKHIMRNQFRNVAWNVDPSVNRGRQLEDSNASHYRDLYNQDDINRYSNSKLNSDISTGRGPLHTIQREDKQANGDPNASVGGGRAFGDHVMSNGMVAKGQRFNSEKSRFTAWRETPWIPSEIPKFIKKNNALQNRNDENKENVSEVKLYLDTKTGRYVKRTNAGADSEGRWQHGDIFPHRDRLSDVWHRGYPVKNEHTTQYGDIHSSNGATQIIEDVPIFEDGVNRYRDSKWTGGYNLGTESEGEVDGEPIKNLRTGTRVSTSIPTVVTTYTLPNGTRVVRLRRIVRYRKPDDESKSFGDVAKNLIQRKLSKFLSLFTVIKFPNEPCMASSGVNGTCYHQLECKSLGGIASGPCAKGYGVCCYFESTCGAITRQNCSYFVNPGYPSPISDMLACILTLEKSNPDVSQIRLDFFMMELLGPTNGTCVEDQFVIAGQNTNSIAPIICGSNTGQHMYVDVDNTRGPIRLNVLAMGGNFPRMFRIKITQVKKGSPLEAPKNCLQYHRGARGTIESFNYQMNADSNLPARPGYMNNLNYAICIKKEPGYCSITYTNDGPFQLTNVDADGQLLIPPGQAGAEVFNCPDDYIVMNGIRLCGERLNDASVQLDFNQNAPVTDSGNGPFMIPVRTNDNTNGRGFRINYQQNQCAG